MSVLFGEDYLQNPYPLLDELRQTPLYYHADSGSWLVTSHAYAMELLRSGKMTTIGSNNLSEKIEEPQLKAKCQALEAQIARWVIAREDDFWKAFRNLMGNFLNVRAIEHIVSDVTRLIRNALSTGVANGGMDVVKDISERLPMYAMSRFLGLSISEMREVRTWSQAMNQYLSLMGTVDVSVIENTYERLLEVRSFLNHRLDSYLAYPEESCVLSALSHAVTDPNQPIERLDALDNVAFLMHAGQETTANLLGNSVYALLRHPEQYQKLRANPECTVSAVEECLRFEPPAPLTVRHPKEEIVLDGQTLEAGSHILLLLNGINRDPQVFPEPHRFQVERQPNPHLAFGYGNHFCLGATLSRLEGRIFLSELCKVPMMEAPLDQLKWRPYSSQRGLESLPVHFV